MNLPTGGDIETFYPRPSGNSGGNPEEIWLEMMFEDVWKKLGTDVEQIQKEIPQGGLTIMSLADVSKIGYNPGFLVDFF